MAPACALTDLAALTCPCCRVLGSSPGACSAYGYKQSHRETLQHTLLYDLVVDPLDAYVLTADQGGSMRMWDTTQGSVLRSIQPEVGAGERERDSVLAVCLLHCHPTTPAAS